MNTANHPLEGFKSNHVTKMENKKRVFCADKLNEVFPEISQKGVQLLCGFELEWYSGSWGVYQPKEKCDPLSTSRGYVGSGWSQKEAVLDAIQIVMTRQFHLWSMVERNGKWASKGSEEIAYCAWYTREEYVAEVAFQKGLGVYEDHLWAVTFEMIHTDRQDYRVMRYTDAMKDNLNCLDVFEQRDDAETMEKLQRDLRRQREGIATLKERLKDMEESQTVNMEKGHTLRDKAIHPSAL
tara:strand:+ start:5066 stop:5782 length:717 start_codon:yes stop_codon:yes gene_type:complete